MVGRSLRRPPMERIKDANGVASLPGINMEFVRSADKSFEWGVAKAAELGYEYVEPMVH